MKTVLAIVLVPFGLGTALALAGPPVAVALLLSLTAVAFVVYVASYVASVPRGVELRRPAQAGRRAQLVPRTRFPRLAGSTRRARVRVSATL